MQLKATYILVRLFFLFIGTGSVLSATAGKEIIVDSKGKGDFLTIQAAINSLPEKAETQRVILVRNGIYTEKIFIDKNFITLKGEDKEKTILTVSQSRDIWRCEHPDDWGVATINLQGSDIVLENLSVINSFGFDNPEGQKYKCAADSAGTEKITRRSSHQMALRSFSTTRLKAINCIFRAYGGDTVSPWNTEDGMFYFKDCLMEGGVDFYCPRGWAWAENCTFVAHGNVAAIWHDGSKYKDSKTVLKNCVFTGEDGFKLGRYHRDAQFYLINCSFPENMADTPVYLNPSNPQNVIRWGERVYYYNSHRKGGDYAWHKNNLEKAEGAPKPESITPQWTFAGKWDPVGEITNIASSQQATDPMAENMLAYQRAVGGWPKAVNEIKVDYTKLLTEAERKAIKADSLHEDATIDNNATAREIRYLVKAYKQTHNSKYLAAAEKGIGYYLKAQYANGGWPQYYPDARLYRSQITYNDNAMINVLNILEDVLEGKNDLDVISSAYHEMVRNAVKKGVSCILATQIKVKGKLTAWCAQYNARTLEPEMARKFELVSLSGNESVGIVSFLMRMKEPSAAIIEAVRSAVDWFNAVRIDGYKYIDVPDAAMPKGTDRVLVPEPGSTVWARFYEIGTNRPFFSGRDSEKKYDVKEIEYERRTGYAWYGTWPEKLLQKEYPEWLKRNKLK